MASNPKSTWTTNETISAVIRMAKEGYGYKEIGDALGISRQRASAIAVQNGHRREKTRTQWLKKYGFDIMGRKIIDNDNP